MGSCSYYSFWVKVARDLLCSFVIVVLFVIVLITLLLLLIIGKTWSQKHLKHFKYWNLPWVGFKSNLNRNVEKTGERYAKLIIFKNLSNLGYHNNYGSNCHIFAFLFRVLGLGVFLSLFFVRHPCVKRTDSINNLKWIVLLFINNNNV